MNDYYVYVHKRASDNTPFYYGRGRRKRAWNFHCRSPWHKSTKEKHGVIVEILVKGLTKDEANTLEILYISEARLRGESLVNLSNGGDGFTSETGKLAGAKGGGTNARLRKNVCDPAVQRTGCRKGGLTVFEKGIGIFDKEALSRNGKIGGKIGGKITGGKFAKDQRMRKVGIFAEGVSSKAGKIGGKKASSQKWKCCECGLVTNAGSLGRHQNSKNHIGRIRIL